MIPQTRIGKPTAAKRTWTIRAESTNSNTPNKMKAMPSHQDDLGAAAISLRERQSRNAITTGINRPCS